MPSSALGSQPVREGPVQVGVALSTRPGLLQKGLPAVHARSQVKALWQTPAAHVSQYTQHSVGAPVKKTHGPPIPFSERGAPVKGILPAAFI